MFEQLSKRKELENKVSELEKQLTIAKEELEKEKDEECKAYIGKWVKATYKFGNKKLCYFVKPTIANEYYILGHFFDNDLDEFEEDDFYFSDYDVEITTEEKIKEEILKETLNKINENIELIERMK